VTAAASTTNCQLYMIVEAIAGEATSARLEAALNAADIASLLLIPPAADGAINAFPQQDRNASGVQSAARYADQMRPLVMLAQSHDTAVLVPDDIELMKTLGCDGVHITHSKDGAAPVAAMRSAREVLLDNFIAGGEAGTSRDGAMQLGEAGADYVGFALAEAGVERDGARADQLQRIAWWADIFEVPCVAFDVETPEQAAALTQAGADFIAFRLAANAPPADVEDYIESVAKAAGLKPGRIKTRPD